MTKKIVTLRILTQVVYVIELSKIVIIKKNSDPSNTLP